MAAVIAAHGAHSCAVVSGALNCWGSNSYGQLGIANNSILTAPSPLEVNIDQGSILIFCRLIVGVPTNSSAEITSMVGGTYERRQREITIDFYYSLIQQHVELLSDETQLLTI